MMAYEESRLPSTASMDLGTTPTSSGLIGDADLPVGQVRARPFSIPNEYDRVAVSCTAQSHGPGARRLPDRYDANGVLAAVQVETNEDARVVLAALDRAGRTIYVDVEPKQAVDLLDVAEELLLHADLKTIKPNDSTVDAAEAVLLHHFGNRLSRRACAVFGTGNLGFKIAMRLAERGVILQVHGRSLQRVSRTVEQLEAILPRHVHRPISAMSGPPVSILVSAVTGSGVVDDSWLKRLAPGAVVLDVGIDNLSPGFIQQAQRQGHTCMRLDVRAAPHPVPPTRNRFFENVIGSGELSGVRIVAGGLIGRLGDLVVDQVVAPRRVVGVANGTGGLVPRVDWSSEQQEGVEVVEAHIRQETLGHLDQ